MPSKSAAIVAVLLGATSARGLQAPEEHPVHWSAAPTRRAVKRGDTVRVQLHAAIDEFWHLYSTTQGAGGPVPTTISLVDARGWSLVGAPTAPAPQRIPDRNFGVTTEVYDDSVTIGIRLVAPAIVGLVAPPRLAIRYQTCTTRYCLPPRTDTVEVAVAVGAFASVPTTPAPFPEPTPAGVARSAPVGAATDIASFGGSSGVGAFLLLAASMGALALLTPCVFPMIPMTVTSFLSVTDDRRRGIGRAALYAMGIVASFTGLGVLTSALFGASGLARFSANPIVNLGIAALFMLFALSLLGVTRIALPSSLMSRVSDMPIRRNSAGTVAMGVIFTLTAFTCTAPFVGTLLVMSAQGTWRWPLTGMIVFSGVFAAPFFVLALVPGLLRHRPTSGDWMPALETIVGAIELAAAIKFVSNADLVLGWGLLTRRVVIAVWISILVALAMALLSRLRDRNGAAARARRVRIASALVAITLAAILIPGLRGRRLGELDAFLPPLPAAGAAVSRDELSWMLNDFRGAIASAARDGRPVLVDFTGYTCTNCRWMEANMFPRADVKRELERFVRVRLYTDGRGEPYATQQRIEQRMFGTVALPLYAALGPDGRPRATFLGMTRDASEFTAFLERGTQFR